MALGGARLLRTTRSRAVRSAAALSLTASAVSTGFVALALPAHAGPVAPTITSPADGTTSNDPAPVVDFTGPGAEYECAAALATDPTPSYTPCASGWSPALGAPGTYVLSVREASLANDGTPATVTYTLDTVAQLDLSGPKSPGKDPRPTWSISTEASATRDCTLDGTAVTCGATYTPDTDLTPGDHTFSVTVTDTAGNTATQTDTYTLDLTAPLPADAVSGPTGTGNDTTPTWSWSNPGNDTALCTLSGGTEAPCTTGTSDTETLGSEGTYQLSVVLEDAAGNRSTATVSADYTLDTTPPPAASFTGGPSGTAKDPNVSWSFTEPGATSRCAVKGAVAGTVANVLCTSPFSYTLPSDDSWRLVVTEDDGYGNTVSTTSGAYTLDTTGPDAPTVSIASPPTGPTNDATPHITWVGEMPVTAQCWWQRTYQGATTTGGNATCDIAAYDPVLPGDGSYVFLAQLTDKAGNPGLVGSSAAYVYDGTAPAAPVLTVPATPNNDPTPTVTFAPEVPGGTAACTFYSGTTAPASPTWTNCTSGTYTPDLPADGTWTLAVTLSDQAGNTSTPATFTYVLDRTAPAAVVISGPTGPSNVLKPTWTMSGNTVDTITCQMYAGIPATTTKVGGKANCPTSFSFDFKGKPDGGYTLQVTATSKAGNTTISTWPYTLDTTAPSTPVVSGPTGIGNAAAPAWTFPVQSGTTAQCRLVQGVALSAWTDCSSGKYTVTNPADGTYTVDVLVTDLAGNQAPIGSSASYTSDRTAPSAPSVTGPTGPGRDPAPTWTWTGEAGAAATCRLDRAGVIGTAVPCNSGSFKPTLTGDTSYVVVVQLTDAAGNAGQATTTAAYLLDTVAPAAPVVSGPSGTSNANPVAWSWTAEGGSTSTCVLVRNGVAGAATGCTSGASTTLPSDGTYALQVTVVDAAGNQSPLVQSPSYVLDRAAPAAPVVTTPVSPSNSTTPAFTFTAEAGAATSCRLLSGGVLTRDWTTCSSPDTVDLTGLGDATYVLEVRATDAAGNTSSSGTSLGYQLDTVAPATPVVTVPTSPSTTTTPTVTWTGETGAVASCRLVLNGVLQTPGPCASPWTPTLVGDGSWVVRVRLTDAAGNVSATGVSGPYVLDTTPPNAPVVSPPAPLGRSTAPSWSASYESGATTQCRLTRGATVVSDWAGCVLPYVTDLSGQPDGTYTLSVRVVDGVGLVSAVGSASYQLDTTAPAAPVFTASPASPGKSRALSFSFTSEAGTTTFCKLTSGATTVSAETACTTPLPVSLAGLADGAYTLSARSVDAAGNSGPTQTATYVLDTTPPAAPVLLSGPAATAPDTTPTWTFTAEAGASVSCSVTGSLGFTKTGSCTSGSFTVTLSADDTYTFTATATDPAGNNGPSLTRTYVLDSTAPATADIVGPKSPGKTTTVSWQVTSSEGTTQCRLTRGATVLSDWGTCGPTFSVTLPSDGAYTLSGRVVDSAGNLSPVTTSVYVLDTVPPGPATVVTPGTPSTDRAPSFVISSADPSVTAQCQVTGPVGVVAPWSPCAISAAGSNYNLNLTTAADGAYTLSVRLTDAAGNTGPTTSGTYVLDTSAPSTVLVTAPTTPSADDTPTWALVGDSDATLECRLTGPGFAGATFSACPTGAVPGTGSFTGDLTAKPDGTFTLTVRSRDSAGNLGPETSSSYELDRTPPSTPAAPVAPASPSNVSTISWTFSVDPGATALCTLSTVSSTISPEAPCTSPLTTVLPADGSYKLTVRAVDAAGNTSAPSSSTYVLDTTPPTAPQFTSTPASPNPNQRPTWHVVATEPNDTLKCQLSSAGVAQGWFDCSGDVTLDLTSFTSGAFALDVVEYDAAGNASATITSSYVLDTTAPAAAVVTAPATGHDARPVFTVSYDPAVASIRCEVATKSTTDTTGTPVVSALPISVCDKSSTGTTSVAVDLTSLGSSTGTDVYLRVFAYDDAGNTQVDPGYGKYVYDTVPPVSPVIAPLKETLGLSAKVAWSFGQGDTENVTLRCVVAKKTAAVSVEQAPVCDGTKDVTLTTYGEWTLTVWSVDQAGNASSPATSSYDYLPPVPAVQGIKAPAPGPDATPTWTFTVPRGYTASCLVSDSSGKTIAAADCTTGRMTPDLTGLPGGAYTLTVQLTDSHGNAGPYSGRSTYRYAPSTTQDGHLGQPGPPTPPAPTTPTGPTGDGGGPIPTGPTTTDGGTTVVVPGPARPPSDGGGSDVPPPGSGVTAAGKKPAAASTSSAFGTDNTGGFITREVPKAIGKTLAQVAQKPTIPLVLLAVVVGFLLLQNRIDRRDPKLASAPVGAEPELDFGPVQGLSGGAPA